MSAPPSPELDDFDGVICLNCEYSLRGLPPDGRCPECGLEIQRSIDRENQIRSCGIVPLELASPAWRKRLGWGCVLLAGTSCMIAIAAGVSLGGRILVLQIIWLASTLTLAAGLWLLGSREPAAVPRGFWRLMPWVARLVAGLLILLPIALMTAPRLVGSWRTFMMIYTIISTVVTFCLLLHVARISRRGGRVFQYRMARVLIWTIPPAWLLQTIFCPFMTYKPNSQWGFTPGPLIGFRDALGVLVYSMVTYPHMDVEFGAWLFQGALTVSLALFHFSLGRTLLRGPFARAINPL